MNSKTIVDVVKVSSKGQIVIPKEIREVLGIVPGSRLVVMLTDDGILLKKLEELSVEEISERIEKTVRKMDIDVDRLIEEAIEWSRRQR